MGMPFCQVAVFMTLKRGLIDQISYIDIQYIIPTAIRSPGTVPVACAVKDLGQRTTGNLQGKNLKHVMWFLFVRQNCSTFEGLNLKRANHLLLDVGFLNSKHPVFFSAARNIICRQDLSRPVSKTKYIPMITRVACRMLLSGYLSSFC